MDHVQKCDYIEIRYCWNGMFKNIERKFNISINDNHDLGFRLGHCLSTGEKLNDDDINNLIKYSLNIDDTKLMIQKINN